MLATVLPREEGRSLLNISQQTLSGGHQRRKCGPVAAKKDFDVLDVVFIRIPRSAADDVAEVYEEPIQACKRRFRIFPYDDYTAKLQLIGRLPLVFLLFTC